MNLTNLPQNVIDCLKIILDSITLENYELFTTVGNSFYKENISKQMFETVSQQLAPRMEKGYLTTYFGHLKQDIFKIYLWKLSFEDGGDDFVARMAMDGDKVAGILIT